MDSDLSVRICQLLFCRNTKLLCGSNEGGGKRQTASGVERATEWIERGSEKWNVIFPTVSQRLRSEAQKQSCAMVPECRILCEFTRSTHFIMPAGPRDCVSLSATPPARFKQTGLQLTKKQDGGLKKFPPEPRKIIYNYCHRLSSTPHDEWPSVKQAEWSFNVTCTQNVKGLLNNFPRLQVRGDTSTGLNTCQQSLMWTLAPHWLLGALNETYRSDPAGQLETLPVPAADVNWSANEQMSQL